MPKKNHTKPISHADALAMDVNDPLADLRDAFFLPDNKVYLDGNSLGAAPRAAFAALRTAAELEWAQDLITSWNTAGWFSLTQSLGDRLARLLGADAGELVICDSTSINLHKALSAALSLRSERMTIIAEANSFPSDLYIAAGIAAQHDAVTIRLVGRDGDSLDDLLEDDVGVCLLNAVDFKSGELRDMHADTQRVQRAGALVVWDLSHAAGALPVELNCWNIDFAVGCTYKYLNGGPGSPGYIFAAQRHHSNMRQPLTGWWGHAEPFTFASNYRAPDSINKMLTGTQPILSMRPISAALDIFERTSIAQLREKSIALSELFIALAEHHCASFNIQLLSPRNPQQRGSQLAFTHPEAYAVMQALIERGVIGDFRTPDVLRFGFAPLYTRFVDVWQAVHTLHTVLHDELWRAPQYAQKNTVT